MILNLNIHYTRAADLIRTDNILTDPWVPLVLYRDGFGNWCTRLVAPVGHMRITADAVINDRGLTEPIVSNAQQHTVESLPEETLVYLLGSRYCDTEHLSAVAWNLFGNTVPGWPRVQAICNFVNQHITFGINSRAQPRLPRKRSTNDRAFAGTTRIWRSRYVDVLIFRLAIAPGYLGDIGIPPVDAPMDFAGWFEAYIGGPGTRLTRAITRRALAVC